MKKPKHSAPKPAPKEGDVRPAARRCWQCKQQTEVFEHGDWYCINKCGPEGLGRLLRI